MHLNKPYFLAIDGLRAIAVLAVVLFHFEVPYFSGGYIGVDVFFVISGYLITLNISDSLFKKTFTYKGFYISRIRRLFPAMLVTVLLVYLTSCLLFSPDHFAQVSNSAVASVFSVANIYFLSTSNYFDTSAITKPLLHFWSLSIEEQFYIFWPFLLCWLLAKKNYSDLTQYILFILLLIGLLYSSVTVFQQPEMAFFSVHTRAFEFLLGAVIVFIDKRVVLKLTSSIFVILALSLIIYSIIFFDGDTPFPSYYSLVPCLGAFLLIINKDNQLAKKLLGNLGMASIGKISYSIYLVHWPVWVFFSYWKYTPVTLFETLLLLLVTFILSYFLYINVEKKYRMTFGNNSVNFTNKAVFRKIVITYAVIFSAILIIDYSRVIQPFYLNNDAGYNFGTVGCEVYDTDDRYAQEKKCKYGQQLDAKKSILVIGDSHAEQWAYGLNKLGLEHGINFDSWTFTGCPLLLNAYKIFGISSSPPPIREALCREKIKEWYKYIVENSNRYDAVVLASRWGWLTESGDYGDYQVRQDSIADLATDFYPTDIKKRREFFGKYLSNTITAIQKTGIEKIILFSQPPLLGRNVQGCNKVPGILYSDNRITARCDHGVKYEDTFNRLEFTNQTITSLGSNSVLSIIPSDYLCNTVLEECPIISGGKLLYHDRDHINAWGAIYLVDQFSGEIMRFLN